MTKPNKRCYTCRHQKQLCIGCRIERKIKRMVAGVKGGRV